MLRPLALIAVSLLTFAGSTALADTFIKQVSRTAPIKAMGQEIPGKTDTTLIWMSKEKSYQQSSDGNGVLFDAKTGMIYLIDHGKKSITELSLANGLDLSAMAEKIKAEQKAEGKELSAEEEAAMNDMMGMMSGLASGLMQSIEFSITPTSETKKINAWNTTRYDLSMTAAGMPTTGVMWVTTDINVDMGAYQRLAFSKLAGTKGFDKLISEAEKIKGMPVMTHMVAEAMGVKADVVTEVLEVADRTAPPGTFDLPASYKHAKSKVNMGK